MRATNCHLAAVLIGIAFLTSGCGDSVTAPNTGALQVVVSTEGETFNVDPDGYTFSIDGGPPQPVASSAAVTVADLPAGNHVVLLGGVAPNCSVLGANPRSVVVVANPNATAPVTVPFIVSCIPRTGSIQVTTATTGTDPDPDGYSITVGGVPKGNLPVNGTIRIDGNPEGQVEVTLGGVSANCVVDGNPRVVAVSATALANIAFAIRCEQPGSLQVTISTTGAYLDPNGYDLGLRLQGLKFGTHTVMPTNGTATISGLFPGNYELTISDVEPNCEMIGPNPRVVPVSPGSTASVSIDVSCEAPREIAIVKGTGSSADIFIISSNNTSLYSITSQPGSDADPAWSPDGSRVAFTSERDGNREIYVMNANGSNPVRLTNVATADDYRPAWSPNGQKIAFVSARDGNAEIYVMNADGTNPVRLTSNTAYDVDPAWSPDGSRIAFASDRDGTSGIWVMNADGSSPTRLTTNSKPDRQPAWSPDGSKIAFARTASNTSDIFTVQPDGSGVTQLTHNIDYAADPDWSPDGRKIVLGATPANCDGYYYYCDPYIVIIRADGTLLSTLGPKAFNPAWRP